jgi:hypothetical protein
MTISFDAAVNTLDQMFGGAVDRDVIFALLESNGGYLWQMPPNLSEHKGRSHSLGSDPVTWDVDQAMSDLCVSGDWLVPSPSLPFTIRPLYVNVHTRNLTSLLYNNLPLHMTLLYMQEAMLRIL